MLPGTTKLLAFHADQRDEDSSNLDPVFNFEDAFELLRSTSSARTYARTNTLAERAYTRLRYALGVVHLALGRRFRAATLGQRIGLNIMPAGLALAALTNRRSGVVLRVPMPVELSEPLKGRLPCEGLGLLVATPLHLMSRRSRFKGLPEMWAFRVAFLELGERSRLAVHVGRIWSCIGPIYALTTVAIRNLRCIASLPERMVGTIRCRNLKRACSCTLHQISVVMVSGSNTLADEQSSPPLSGRMPGSPLEKPRNTANPESSMTRRRDRTRGGSNRDDVFPFGKRLRQREHYFRLKRASPSASSTVGSPDTAIATV